MILTGHDEEVAEWAAERLGQTFVPPYMALGVVQNGEMTGAIVLNDFCDRNVELTAVGRGAVTRAVMRGVSRYCFETLNCRRITVRTRARNVGVRHLIERLGAFQEGYLPDWYDDDDCVIYGLKKADCKFLERR